ncbi:MAG: phosphatase PAP2 family protein [Chitinophagaceae bacterium]|nr:MAG: phosphatase PAP2 family protein [Chitinophagaceae bacterium]
MLEQILRKGSSCGRRFLAAGLLLALGAAPAGAQEKEKIDTVTTVTAKGAAKDPGDREVKQIVHKVNPWVTIPVSAVMTAGNFYAIPNILHAKKDISQAEIDALRPELLNGIDRMAVKQDPHQRDKWFKISDVALPATIFSSFAIFLDKNVRKDWAKVALMFYETQAVTFTVYNFSPLGPSFQNRLRPLVYYEGVFDPNLRLKGGQRNSMFSGHAANAAAATFFAVKVYSDYHPEIGKKKYLLYALAALPPLFTGYTRVKALAHFPSDVFLGLLVGSVAGVTIPSLHKVRPKTVQFGITSTEMGTGPSVTWKPAKKKFRPLNDFNSFAAQPK